MSQWRSYSLYIVDCLDDVRYVGITSDVPMRAIEHFTGVGGSITTEKHPFREMTIVAEHLPYLTAERAETALASLLREAGQEVYGGGYVENRERDSESGLRKAEKSVGTETTDRKDIT